GDIKANKSAFAEIPVLIIDDESDQASVNTVDPEKVAMAKAEGREIKERRAINEQIAAMLELMPRAQYVGYTATPFANVFVDPADEQGIFPRDFVIGLPRPDGYMGVDDFHDLGVTEDVPTLRSSNRLAFVRDLEAEDDDDQAQEGELAEAMDMFVLTGAVKRWRTATAGIPFPHHTMLIHSSVKTQEHGELAELVKTLWAKAQFSSPAAKKRLQELYDTDVAPVSAARLEDGLPAMPSFGDLATHIPAVISKVTEHTHNPVLVVNSDADIQRNQQALDFDRFDTWRILVGGAKLSRGFTVEGLTVTYFRRATNMGDSLTQMGRWFGFRRGYRDLVRLYIARHARFGNRTVDLYEAFESIALDEAAFRHQLHQYADWEEDGHPAVTPAQIPPLVTQHLPGLRPTANNKMFNAVLDEQSEQPFTPAGYANDPGQLAANLDRWRPLFAHARDLVELPVTKNTTLPAFVGVVDASEVVDALAATKYLPYFFERVVQPKLTLYRRLIAQGLLLDFLVVAPQPATELKVDIGGLGPRSVVSRDRRMGRGGRFGEITDAKHRPWAVSFVGDSPLPQLQQRHLPTRGVVLSYLVKEGKPDYEVGDSPEAGIFPAVSVYVPDASLPSSGGVLRFKVHDPGQSDAVIVEANVKA
ncbi:MAG: Z1 domain-containing protein, partial [Acidimicrobiales bacterium]